MKPNTEWISLKNRLPDYNDPVFLTRDKCVFVGIRSHTDIEGENYSVFKHPKQPEKGESKMTHWMPMKKPELPKYL